MKNTFLHVVKERVLQERWMLPLVILCVLLHVYKSLFDLWCSQALSRLTGKAKRRLDQNFDIYLYVVYSLLVAVIDAVVKCTVIYHKSDARAKLWDRFYSVFLTSKWADWRSTVVGEIYNVLVRRSHAISDVISILSFSLLTTGLYIGYMLYNISRATTREIAGIILVGVVLYFVLFGVLQRFAGSIDIMQNRNWDYVVLRSNDIFLNNDMIYSYGTLEKELDKYSAQFESYLFYMRLKWLTNCTLDAMKAVFVLAIKVFLYTQSIVLYPSSTTEVKTALSLFEKSFAEATQLSKNIETLISLSPVCIEDRFLALEKDDVNARGVIKQTFDNEIRVSNLSCVYETQKVFSGVGFKIKKGEKLAITGCNGSGKTSFIRQLLRLCDSDGCIRIDGIDINAVDRAAYANLVTYIPQSSLLFNESILDNIRCFDRSIPPEDVVKRCIQIGFHDDFKSLGYDFKVQEGGNNLSFAQKQKVAIARALLKNQHIIVVDELTIDAATADLLLNGPSDQTVIMVTHQMKLLKCFDRILFCQPDCFHDHGDLAETCAASPEFVKFYNENT